MVIGICRVTLLLHEAHSLKEKRQVLKSLMEKVMNRFNVSIAEVDDNDLWQRASIGIAAVGNDRSFINATIDKVMDFIDSQNTGAEVVDEQMEIMNL